MKNQEFLDILTARNQFIDGCLESAESRLFQQVTDDKNMYKTIMFKLIVQGLVKMMEPSVIIKVRSKDVNIAKSVLKQAQDYFKTATGMSVILDVNEKEFLPARLKGGVYMYSKAGSIILDNSLHSKLELVRASATPYIRKAMFGPNVNRRFMN